MKKILMRYYKTKIRRAIKRFERRHNLYLTQDLIVALLGMVAAIIVWLVGNAILTQISKPIVIEVKTVEAETIITSPTPTVTPMPTKAPLKQGDIINSGKASYYSIDGCLGCNPGRIMANGEELDDNKYTLAHNQIPLNTMVEVVNTRNGKSAIAKVTDRGGFNRLNRIADLSLALAKTIDLKTDVDIITITPVK